MDTFDEDLFIKGLEQRKATLGAEYVENNLAAADDFTRPFQEAMTAWQLSHSFRNVFFSRL